MQDVRVREHDDDVGGTWVEGQRSCTVGEVEEEWVEDQREN